MQVINFYLVSIFLSCIKSSLAPTVGAAMTMKSPLLLQNSVISSQNKNNGGAFLSLKGNHLTKKYPKITSKAMSVNSSNSTQMSMSAIEKNNSDPFAQDYINYYDQLEDTFYDNPGPPGTPPFNLYKATVGVVRAVFNTLQSIQENNMTQKFTIADVIEDSFGIFDDIALTVTGSMSILYFLKINSDRLGKAFNCLFDAKHMVKNADYRENFISKMETLINDIGVFRNKHLKYQFGNVDLDTVAKNLESVLFDYKVGNYNYSDIDVNVQLMKNMVLINQTDSKVLNKVIKSISKDFLEEVIDKQYEVDGSSIAKRHSEAMRNVMPAVFSLLINHIEVLKMLSTLEVHEENKKTIQFANKLLKVIMSFFINRLKNFGELTKKELSDINILDQLILTLDTGETEPIEAPSTSKIDIKLLLPLTKQAIAAVLNLTGKKATENWEDHNVFKFKTFLKNQGEEYYMNLLTENANLSCLLVKQFEGSILDEVDYIMSENEGNDEVFYL